VPEISAKIGAVGKVKDTVAWVDMLAASAGYYMASQCNKIIAAPSADLGSVGVYSIYTDESRALDKMGITVNAISAGAHKLDGASFQVMTPEVKARFQADVDYIYKEFKAAVTSKRDIADEDLQGQCFTGPDLITKGFVDSFANDFGELMQTLLDK
jgi:ClpP class serine protease